MRCCSRVPKGETEVGLRGQGEGSWWGVVVEQEGHSLMGEDLRKGQSGQVCSEQKPRNGVSS